MPSHRLKTCANIRGEKQIMTADIRYIVKYHPRLVRKVANVLFYFAGLIILLLDLIWTPFKGLSPELQGLTIIYILPKIFWDMHVVAFFSIAFGSSLLLFKWRSGKIELYDDKLVINGSYYVSIWLNNMWEVDIRDLKYHKWCLKLDSNVDAVQIKFKTEKEFKDFSEKLIQLVEHVESIKLRVDLN
jgi:hypothetical protein